MNIIVPIKQIPSVVDEIELNKAGSNLDFDEFDFVLNEFDEHAIEQGVLVKEAAGGEVTVLGVDLIEELDGVLHTALAKGADKVVKITGDFEPGMASHTQARLLADAIQTMDPGLVLTGVQAADDIDGQIGPMLAAYLDMPYVGVVAGVDVSGGTAKITKEYSGGVMAEFEVTLPVVVGVQAASSPPRYAPVSKIRQMAKTAEVGELEMDAPDGGSGLNIRKMAKPVSTGHAEMIEGDAEAVAAKIIEIIKERGLA
ncbi:MAG: electron transfer flavoprotein subunit beta/FixA family protein [Anaerolineae bacterium]|nr:electron transfer flavoprotein subunit beta/FixA family protein [Anaerolineae bacterium]